MKVAPRFELGMEALQASALPLGHATVRESVVISEMAKSGQALFFHLHLKMRSVVKDAPRKSGPFSPIIF